MARVGVILRLGAIPTITREGHTQSRDVTRALLHVGALQLQLLENSRLEASISRKETRGEREDF